LDEVPAPIETARVPGFILFSPDDYRSLARGARILSKQAEADAMKQQNPCMARLFNDNAKHYRELAEKCELAARVL
jgi:hypothetical protein